HPLYLLLPCLLPSLMTHRPILASACSGQPCAHCDQSPTVLLSLLYCPFRNVSFIYPPIISQCFRKRFNRFITSHAFQNFEEDIRTILRCHIHNVMTNFDFYFVCHRLSIPSLLCNIVKAHNSISSILSSTAAEVSRVITTPTTPLSALNPNSHPPGDYTSAGLLYSALLSAPVSLLAAVQSASMLL